MEHMKYVHKDPNASGVPGKTSTLLIYLSRFAVRIFTKRELLAFPVHERRNTELKRVVQEFVTFSQHCSCLRKLGKQVIVTLRMFEHPDTSGVPGKNSILLI